MTLSLALGAAVFAGNLTVPKYYVVDFLQVGGLPVSTLKYDVLINAKSCGHKPLKGWFPFRADMSTKQLRDDAFERLQRSTSYKVAKVGETKILFYNCFQLSARLEAFPPGRREVPAITQPTVKVYLSEKDAFQGK